MRSVRGALHNQAIVTGLLMLATGSATADPVKQVKTLYGAINKDIRKKLYKQHRIVASTIVPAIGEQTKVFRMFSRPDKTLAKVTLKYDVAASAQVYEELVFDSSAKLVFYFQKTTEAPIKDCENVKSVRYDRRVYLSGGKPVLFRWSGKVDEPKDVEKETIVACRKELDLGGGNYKKPKTRDLRLLRTLERRAADYRRLLVKALGGASSRVLKKALLKMEK